MTDHLVHRLEPYADHLTFVISDAEATEGHCIAVGTARYDFVPVTLTVQTTRAAAAPLYAFDHVVEADITLPSGKLATTGATQLPDEVEPLHLPAGLYGARICYAQTDQRPAKSNLEDFGDYLEYLVTMWPTDEDHGVEVLEQGPLALGVLIRTDRVSQA
ncbi:hypothetical protein [Asanoa sp. NPDC050611]|uniref:hypothetical protein n=1 Tax=Asanoa sp. NPDC050611 TaxID=3157098 RepID=UPI003405B667